MTEQEWLDCEDPESMLEFLKDKASERKLRLLACACCYQLWHLVQDEAALKALQASEQYADGHVTKNQLTKAQMAHQMTIYGAPDAEHDAYYAWRAVLAAGEGDARGVALFATWKVVAHETGKQVATRTVDYRTGWCAIIRDICNPFHPDSLDPSWLTPQVVNMAQEIYGGRAFDRLPALADALEKAGCGAQEILNHCRGPGPHVKGCWLVDLILGKE